MDSPGKIRKMKTLRERLIKKVSLTNIDSVFLDNGAKNVIAQSILAQILKASRPRLT
jgi:hypothetical protein